MVSFQWFQWFYDRILHVILAGRFIAATDMLTQCSAGLRWFLHKPTVWLGCVPGGGEGGRPAGAGAAGHRSAGEGKGRCHWELFMNSEAADCQHRHVALWCCSSHGTTKSERISCSQQLICDVVGYWQILSTSHCPYWSYCFVFALLLSSRLKE